LYSWPLMHNTACGENVMRSHRETARLITGLKSECV
jgi:hypothetical protein